MKLILDALEQARLNATPSDAMQLADAIADLRALADALDRNGFDISEAAGALDDLHALREHVKVQPFDVSEHLTLGDVVRGPIIDETETDAFADWLGELERLAQ